MNEIDYLFTKAMEKGPAHLDIEDWKGADWAWREAKHRYELAWQVLGLLWSHSGETGKDEGALEILQRIIRERDEARGGHDFQKTEEAVEYLRNSIRSLHNDVLRADGDLSELRGRMQQPWFDQSQERKRLLCLYETFLGKLDCEGDLETAINWLSTKDENTWRNLRKQVREAEWFTEITE